MSSRSCSFIGAWLLLGQFSYPQQADSWCWTSHCRSQRPQPILSAMWLGRPLGLVMLIKVTISLFSFPTCWTLFLYFSRSSLMLYTISIARTRCQCVQLQIHPGQRLITLSWTGCLLFWTDSCMLQYPQPKLFRGTFGRSLRMTRIFC